MDLIKEYLTKITVVETCEWAGFINRDIIPLMNEIILRWQTAELKNNNAIRANQIEKIYEQGYGDISKILEDMNKNKYNKDPYRQTVSQIVDLFNKFGSINLFSQWGNLNNSSGGSSDKSSEDISSCDGTCSYLDNNTDNCEPVSDYSDDEFQGKKLRVKLCRGKKSEYVDLDEKCDGAVLEKVEDVEDVKDHVKNDIQNNSNKIITT